MWSERWLWRLRNSTTVCVCVCVAKIPGGDRFFKSYGPKRKVGRYSATMRPSVVIIFRLIRKIIMYVLSEVWNCSPYGLREKNTWLWFFAISHYKSMGTFFGDYVAMVTPIGKKSNRTPFPTEPHVLMYILRGWRKWCGTSSVPNSCKRNGPLQLTLEACYEKTGWTIDVSFEYIHCMGS